MIEFIVGDIVRPIRLQPLSPTSMLPDLFGRISCRQLLTYIDVAFGRMDKYFNLKARFYEDLLTKGAL